MAARSTKSVTVTLGTRSQGAEERVTSSRDFSLGEVVRAGLVALAYSDRYLGNRLDLDAE